MRLAALAVTAIAAVVATHSTAIAQPSFDCRNASTHVERIICDDPRIAQLDSELAEAYRIALRDSPWASANRRIRAEQREWLSYRNACTTVRCVRGSYYGRIGELHAEVGGDGGASDPPRAIPATMMAVCRQRASDIFHTRMPNVETKYEGQRVDGTHAVNGTVYLRSHDETFQCSFDPSGSTIVQFIVN